MIPVLAIPILNRGDLLLRCIRSIDYPVRELLLVNNGDDAGVAAAIGQLQDEGDHNLRVYKPGFNMGVAASWNWIVKNAPPAGDEDRHYWLLVGNDIQFALGDLRKIDAFIRAHPDYILAPANWGHSLFAVMPACIEQVGYFDENFHPAYSEDQDQMYRVKLAGLDDRWADVPNVLALHGEPPLWGSSTVWSDPELNRKCEKTQANNHDYYQRKWGGPPGEETYLHPYDNPELAFRDWTWDKGLAKKNDNPNCPE